MQKTTHFPRVNNSGEKEEEKNHPVSTPKFFAKMAPSSLASAPMALPRLIDSSLVCQEGALELRHGGAVRGQSHPPEGHLPVVAPGHHQLEASRKGARPGSQRFFAVKKKPSEGPVVVFVGRGKNPHKRHHKHDNERERGGGAAGSLARLLLIIFRGGGGFQGDFAPLPSFGGLGWSTIQTGLGWVKGKPKGKRAKSEWARVLAGSGTLPNRFWGWVKGKPKGSPCHSGGFFVAGTDLFWWLSREIQEKTANLRVPQKHTPIFFEGSSLKKGGSC